MADNAKKMPQESHRAAAFVSRPSGTPAFLSLLADLAAPAFTEAPQLPLATLDSAPNRSRLLVQLLQNRGISGASAIDAFLDGDWRAAKGPLLNLDLAVARIRRAIAEAERIVVYGDFDCDGITSCALLTVALRSLGAHVEPYVPKRDDDGRGLNLEAVRELAGAGTRLVITTDCGTANVDEVEVARSLGMDVIVTDHHPAHGPIAPAYAVVNPQQEGDTSGEGDLAGVGVAFRLAQALLKERADVPARNGEETLEDALDALLDLVAIGTVADVVPLTAVNWALARAGLRRMATRPRPGVRALLAAARAYPAGLVARDISFALAPRLNACGRMGQPELAVRILVTDDDDEARVLALRVEALNQERQARTEGMLAEARKQAESQRASQAALIAVGDRWPLGIIGLVAGRLAEEYRRPAFVISRDADECRGSARGPEGVNLGELLAARPDFFKRFGGHARAAGFTLATDDLDRFLAYVRERFAALSEELRAADEAGANGPRTITVDCRLRLNRLTRDSNVYADIEALEPFGADFAEPVFLTPELRITSCRRSGPDGRTLRLSLSDGHGTMREAIWSRRGEFCDRLKASLSSLPLLDVAYTLRRYQTAFGEPVWRMHVETVAKHEIEGEK